MTALGPPATPHRALFGSAVVAGTAVLAVAWSVAGNGAIPLWEESLFRSLNDLPDWIERPGWLVMQLGSFAAIPIAIAGCVVLLRDRRLAGRVAVAGATAWLITRVVKEIVQRDRPDVFLDDIALRTAADGLGFSSGHAAVAFALATVFATRLPRGQRWAVWTVAGVAGLMRIYTAAHFPLDVIGGWGLGLAVGGAIALIPATRP